MNHLILIAIALSAMLALSACGADGKPVPPTATTTTGAAVGLTVGSGGVQPSAAVGIATSTNPRTNLTLSGGLSVGLNR